MDQANGLRELVQSNQVNYSELKVFKNSKVIAVTSGKGGVGKSNFVANLAINLQSRGNKVLIIDADVGLANIELLFDVTPKKTFKSLLDGEDINDVLTETPIGIKLLSGGSGIVELSNISARQQDILIQTFSYLEEKYDYILIDTGAGISDLVLKFLKLADETIIVTLPEPTAITDAYALLKVANNGSEDIKQKYSIVVNRVATPEEGEFVVRKLSLVAKKFLDLDINGLGVLSEDQAVIKSVKRQNVMEVYNNGAKYAKDIECIVNKLIDDGVDFEELAQNSKSKIMTRLKSIFISR